jgi:hypothetical protein
MPSSYSTNLKIELQATGENSGTWGTITNTNLGTALEQAIIGYGNPNYLSDANLTLTYTDTNSAQTARALVLNVTSALSLTGTRELVVPTIQKQYIVQNNTTGGQSITVKTSAGTGITVPNGRKAHLYVNGTDVIYMDDFVDINGGAIDGTPIGANSAAAGTFTALTASGVATFSAGTVAAPSITTTGDTNTGIFFPAADTIAFTEGGVEAARFDSSGRFGIGTEANALTNALTVYRTGSTQSAMAAGNSNTGLNGTLFGVDTTGNGIINQTQALPLIFSTSNTERMRLESGGNLAFSSTAQRITADMSNATVSNRFAFQTSTTNGNTQVNAIPNGTSTTSQFIAYNASDPTNASSIQLAALSTTTRLLAGQTGTGSYLPLTFFTSGSEQARLDTSGNLGIGTSSPITKLDVRSDAAVVTVSGYAGWHFNALPASATARAATIRKNYDSPFDFNIYASTGSSGNTAATIFYRDIVNESMRLDSSGNLGIGTANPGTFGKFASVAASGATSVYTGTGVQGLFISTNESTRVVRYDSSGSLSGLHAWGNGPTELMRLDTSGNLGIGTSSPLAKLDTGSALGQKVLTYGSGNVRYGLSVESSEWRAFAAAGAVLTFGHMSTSDGTTYTERMRLDSSGNLGIGTSSPAFRLDVLTGVEGDSIRLNNNNANIGAANTFGFVVAESGSARVNLRYRRDGSGSAELYNVSNGPFVFGTNNTERARIDANGNIVAGASAALATTATNGFLYVPTCAGTPTGTPTAITGMAPIVVDTTNNKLYFYSTGVWRDAGP